MALGENLEEVVNILTRYYSGQLDLLPSIFGIGFLLVSLSGSWYFQGVPSRRRIGLE